MEIFLDILVRILFIIFIQFMWDSFIHRGMKNIDNEIYDLKEENYILTMKCYELHKESGTCTDYCPGCDCVYNKKRK